MNADAYIGVDVGSGSVRAGIFTSTGERLAFAVRPISQFHDSDERVEQSSVEIWQAVGAAVSESVRASGIDPAHIRAVGFDATCSLVAVAADGTGISVSPAGEEERDIIMWRDHRAQQEAKIINYTGDETLRYLGGEVSVEMELPKILWLKRHLPQRYQQIWRLFDLADYLVWRACGNDIASTCTLTCKWNYLAHEQRFSHSLLRAIGLEEVANMIPGTVREPGEKAGTLRPEVARQWGLCEEVVVATGIIDAHAGGLSLSGGQPQGSLAIISGTSNCHMIVSKQPIVIPGVWGPYWGAMMPQWWLNEGGQSAAGALVDWTLQQHSHWVALQQEANARGESPYQLINQLVEQLEAEERWPTRHLHVLGDHHGNRSPRANPQSRGAIYGLTLESGADGLARLYLATLQAIAYGTRHIIDAMRAAGHDVSRIMMCGGATKNPLWLREYANATGCDIHLAREEDAVTLGAALLGSVACGGFASLTEAVSAMSHRGKSIIADLSPQTQAFHQAKYQVYLQMYDDLQRAEQQFSAIMHNTK
ncbi:FGGY-family carbohydrate kinase [Klebsiella indica]|uniref:FGGY-family carbohydrate kinase n=1 Tax=Klebsiella indica TaxID=2582917 RepID=A0A5R9LD42_9ENTR|nr:FGGY-family carbohydrate kinase [Klebsiella indica]TLV10585.1 FGGY-family carbohydrate kinase [Klebsiella indica]